MSCGLKVGRTISSATTAFETFMLYSFGKSLLVSDNRGL
jgi:hypothetical protein